MMKFVYCLEDLDCAHCAAKMETAISKIEGVEDAQINFLTQRLIIEADESSINYIIKRAAEVCKKIEPDCRIILK